MLTLFLSATYQHTCVHDKLLKALRNNETSGQTSVYSGSGQTSKLADKIVYDNTTPKQAFRIYVDYSAIEISGSDGYRCSSEGQVIKWSLGTYTCLYEDIITREKYDIIKGTMDNVADLVSSALKVIPETGSISPSPEPNSKTPTESISGYDYYVSVFARPYGEDSTTLASAVHSGVVGTNKRPLQGYIYMNLNKLPGEPQSMVTVETEFFMTCYHELCHAIGISKDLLSTWYDAENSISYNESNLPYQEITAYDRTFYILNTPECHKFATKRFGVENFDFNGVSVKSGVELEDGGDDSTRLSHPEARVWINDVMVGVSTYRSVLSELTFAMLKDSGWFDVNYSYTSPLAWGLGDSIDGNTLYNFGALPPAYFPTSYTCQSAGSQASYDFESYGLCSPVTVDCSSSSFKAYCSGSAYTFYNANNTNLVGSDQVFDYMLIPVPYTNRVCNQPSTFTKLRMGESTGSDSRVFQLKSGDYGCYTARCNGLDLYVTIMGYEVQCKSAGSTAWFLLTFIKCPDPEHFCRTYALTQTNNTEEPFSDDYSISLVYETDAKGTAPWKLYVPIILAVIVLIIISAVCCMIKQVKRREERRNTYSGDGYRDGSGSV